MGAWLDRTLGVLPGWGIVVLLLAIVAAVQVGLACLAIMRVVTYDH